MFIHGGFSDALSNSGLEVVNTSTKGEEIIRNESTHFEVSSGTNIGAWQPAQGLCKLGAWGREATAKVRAVHCCGTASPMLLETNKALTVFH
jgi:hypothetical protein